MDQFIFHARKKHSWATRYARDLHKHCLSNCHSPRWLLLCFHSTGEKLRLGEAKWPSPSGGATWGSQPSRLTARGSKAAGGPAGCAGAALRATRKFSLFCHGLGELGLHRNPNRLGCCSDHASLFWAVPDTPSRGGFQPEAQSRVREHLYPRTVSASRGGEEGGERIFGMGVILPAAPPVMTGTRGVHDSCSYRSCSPLYFSSAFHCDLRYFSNIIGTFCFLSL